MTNKITFATAAPITLTVSQMLTISISLGEAADWNAENDYPQHAAELRQLRVELRKQFRPFFDALDNEAVIGTIDRPKQDDLFNLAVDIARQQP